MSGARTPGRSLSTAIVVLWALALGAAWVSAPASAPLPAEARVPPSQLLDLLERHGCNLYGVTGAAGEDVAGASFAGFFHLFNHSCIPNVVFDSAHPEDGAAASGAAPLFALGLQWVGLS